MSKTASSRMPAIRETTPEGAPGVLTNPISSVAVTVELDAVVHEPPLHQKSPNDMPAEHCDKCGSTGARNLVVCIDGTSNQFSTKNTNVVELYSRLVKDKQQLTFYNSGIGTYAKPSWKSWSYRKQVIANKLDLAFALRFEKIILSAYAWLVDNYDPGDRIFLFGFSRGAYQVRALAAMIDVVGLLYKGNNDQIPFAYELYAASDDEYPDSNAAKEGFRRISVAVAARVKSVLLRGRMPSSEPEAQPSSDPPIRMQDQFKNTFSQPNVHVHFVGVWETVSSVGFIRDKTLPRTTDGMKCTCFFRHALALHEFRVKFLPEYVNGSRGPGIEKLPAGAEPHTKEVWFSGSHSDIGGGSIANTTLDKFGPALRWMLHEATLAGLRIKEGQRKWDQGNVSKSMTFIWRIVECLPIKRLEYAHWDPYSDEDAPTCVLVDRSSLASAFIGLSTANRSRSDLPAFARQEQDAYATLVLRPRDQVLKLGCILDDRNISLLNALISSEDGVGSLRELNIVDYIYDMAQSCWNSQAAQQVFNDLRSLHNAYVKGVSRFANRIDEPEAVDLPGRMTSETFPFHMCGHTGGVSSLAFLSGSHVVSGSWDGTIRIWDVSTGLMSPVSQLNDYSSNINCISVHAAKGLVASASDGGTVRLWMSDRNGTFHEGKVLKDESRLCILAVAFSLDGSHLVSGSEDGNIRVWNAATGERTGEPVPGHTGWVLSLAFAADGTRIVSGSNDRTVRLWEWSPDEATALRCGEPLSAHTARVNSVAFSPDARVIASASDDKTVRLWDVATPTQDLTLNGHTDYVHSVAFAPSGRHVVSGSSDWTVCIWDARTGAAVRVLRGHTSLVWSVSFSPDGTRIASGSYDKTVRVWDVPDEC